LPLSQIAKIVLLRALHRRILQVWALLWQSQRSFNKAGAARPQQSQAERSLRLLGLSNAARLPAPVVGVMH